MVHEYLRVCDLHPSRLSPLARIGLSSARVLGLASSVVVWKPGGRLRHMGPGRGCRADGFKPANGNEKGSNEWTPDGGAPGKRQVVGRWGCVWCAWNTGAPASHNTTNINGAKPAGLVDTSACTYGVRSTKNAPCEWLFRRTCNKAWDLAISPGISRENSRSKCNWKRRCWSDGCSSSQSWVMTRAA